MNVLYVCPKCGARLFAPPGGTPMKCITHTDTKYQQVEAYNGPDGLFVDESGTTRSRGHINPQGQPVKNQPKPIYLQDHSDILKDGSMDQLRALYLKAAREAAPKTWGKSRLVEEIKAAIEARAKEAVIEETNDDLTEDQAEKEMDNVIEVSDTKS